MDLPRYYANLGLIINGTPEEARALVEGYNEGDHDFFEGYFAKLKSAKLNRNRLRNNSYNETLFIQNDTAGRGAYGEVSKNRNNPYVYKLIKQPKPFGGYGTRNTHLQIRTTFLKMLFNEVIVQVALQNDETYGKCICKIYKVYRNGNDAILKLEALQVTMRAAFIQLNVVPINGKSIVNIRSEILRDALVRIFEILIHFRSIYSFRHNDLHTVNIMTTADSGLVDNLKLIDFGFSYIKIGIIENGEIGLRKEDAINLCNFSARTQNISSNMIDLLNMLEDLPAEKPLEVYLDKLKTAVVANAAGGRRKTMKKHRRFRLPL